jgi:hypothetical protein
LDVLSLSFQSRPSWPHVGSAPSSGPGKGQWISGAQSTARQIATKKFAKPFESCSVNPYVDAKEAGFHTIQN